MPSRFRGFRRRRRFSFRRPGKAPGGSTRKWINSFFFQVGPSQILGTNEFVDIFQLVDVSRYTSDWNAAGAGDDPNTQREHATVVRTVGRVLPDLLTGAPGSNGLEWSACIFVMKEQALIDQFSAGAMARFAIHPGATIGDPAVALARLQPMAWMPFKGFSHTFRENLPGPNACADFFSHYNNKDEATWSWDVRQRRRMVSDDGLWLLVSGTFVCDDGTEQSPIRTTVASRTLIHDHD